MMGFINRLRQEFFGDGKGYNPPPKNYTRPEKLPAAPPAIRRDNCNCPFLGKCVVLKEVMCNS